MSPKHFPCAFTVAADRFRLDINNTIYTLQQHYNILWHWIVKFPFLFCYRLHHELPRGCCREQKFSWKKEDPLQHKYYITRFKKLTEFSFSVKRRPCESVLQALKSARELEGDSPRDQEELKPVQEDVWVSSERRVIQETVRGETRIKKKWSDKGVVWENSGSELRKFQRPAWELMGRNRCDGEGFNEQEWEEGEMKVKSRMGKGQHVKLYMIYMIFQVQQKSLKKFLWHVQP